MKCQWQTDLADFFFLCLNWGEWWCMCGCNRKHNLQGSWAHLVVEISWEASSTACWRMTLGVYTQKERKVRWYFCTALFSEKPDVGTVWAVWGVWGSCGTKLDGKGWGFRGLVGNDTFIIHITVSHLFPYLPPPSSSHPPPLVFVSFSIHDDLLPFLSVCFWLCCLFQQNPSSPNLYRPPTTTTTSPFSHFPQCLYLPVSWSRGFVQVEARVVLSFSGFTHSRYYHQAPVSLADSHLDRAVNHLANNDGWCPLCRAWCPQMKGLHQAWP